MTLPKDQGGLDFRDIQSINDAFLTKLSWRIVRHPENLLARIVTGKYCTSDSFFSVPVSATCSHGWRGIMLGRDMILDNMGWAVGNGTSINVWDSPWLCSSAQIRQMGPAPEALSNTTASDLFLAESNAWDPEKIRLVLPFYEQEILAIKPSLSGAPDKIIWVHNETGEYTTKSGYAMARAIIPDTTPLNPYIGPFDWKKSIWNLHTAPKLKLFLWKTFHNALPTGDQLLIRQIAVNGKCKSYGLPESIDHLFLHCSFAQHVWHITPFSLNFEYSGSIDLKSAWNSLLTKKNLPPTGLLDCPLAPWIIWQLWIERNTLLFEDRRCSAIEVITKAVKAAREWAQCQIKSTQQTSRVPAVAPIEQCVVVRTDAAWHEHLQLAGLGWTIETSTNSSSFAVPAAHVRSPLLAEALAVREALMKCRELNLPRLRLESDSATLIKILKSEVPNSELYGVAADVFFLANSFERLSFVWIHREKNVVADGLEKQVLSVELAINDPPNSG